MSEKEKIPKGKIRRSTVAGVAVMKAGTIKAGQLTKAPFQPKDKREASKKDADEQVARIVFDALSVLRGTALKAAQVIAMEIDLIPEEYRKELSKAYNRVPPMNKALLRKVIKSELGDPKKVFKEFELVPFAAASLGQVHRAETFDGKKLAVKVQYPGMDEAVASDIKMLKTLLAPTKYYRIFKSCFEEISNKVAEELDYQLEAQNTVEFASFAWDEIKIPQVESQYSTRRVITTELLSGAHLDEWLTNDPSQDERDRFGQLLVDFFNRCIFETNVIHADPNPGNFLFLDDGRLGVIDFGCIKKLEPDFVDTIRRLTSCGEAIDADEIEELHRSIGISYRSKVDPAELREFLSNWLVWIREPYQSGSFDYSKERDYFQRGAAFAKILYRYIHRYDGPFVYYGRAVQGLMRLLQRLGARVNMHH